MMPNSHDLVMQQVLSLTRNKKAGVSAPHKPVLLLAVMDLFDSGAFTGSRIELTEGLERAFLQEWRAHVGPDAVLMYRPHIAQPFWHMQNEPFWRLMGVTSSLGSRYSVRALRENTYVELDPAFVAWMQDPESRGRLRSAVIEHYFPERIPMLGGLASVSILLGPLAFFAA